MRYDKLDKSLIEALENDKSSDKIFRVILKLESELDPERERFLRDLGADGALVETIFVSTRLKRSALEKVSEESWVKRIEMPVEQFQHCETKSYW